jgi:hypothetical protein
MKMKNRLIAAAILLTVTANAQNARIEAGLNLANVSVTDNGRVDDANMLTSFRVGIIGDIRLAPMVAFQPGILYTGKGSKVQKGQPGDNAYFKQTTNPFYFEVPANIVFSDDDPTTLNEEEGTGLGVMKRFDYGLNGTAGIAGKSLVLGVNYGLGLAKLQSGSNSSEDNNNKHRVLSVTVGFRL